MKTIKIRKPFFFFKNYPFHDKVKSWCGQCKCRLCFHRSQSGGLFMGGDDTQLSGFILQFAIHYFLLFHFDFNTKNN